LILSVILIAVTSSSIYYFYVESNSDMKVGPDRGIILQPFNDVTNEELGLVKNALEKQHNIKVTILERIKMPSIAYVNIKSPRYRADIMLKELVKMKKPNSHFIMGLTSSDISITKHGADGDVKKPASTYNDFGIYGLGYCPGKATIVSTFRLGKNKVKRHDRLLKSLCMS
jgi:archaemetzincin